MKFTFPPETRVLDGYTIKRAIYRGGFGEVYYALSDAGREVALKLLQNNSEVELRGVQQCLNLSHPNLVTIFDVRQDREGDHWIIMEYIAGETLDAAIRRHPAGMPMELVRMWLAGMAAGVNFLHSRGLVHRDLKPANVFSDGDVVKVGDVGLSKFITPSRRSAQTQSVGTVYYMAPEVAKGRYGKEVDVYALGVILYEMLTGRVPFDGESTGEILMKHLSERPDLSPLPPRLQPVIGQALEKDPASRHAGLEMFLRAFDHAVLGREEPQSPKAAHAPEASRPISAIPPPPAPAVMPQGRDGVAFGAGGIGRAELELRADRTSAETGSFLRQLWPTSAGWWTVFGCSLAAFFLLPSFGAESGAALLTGGIFGYLVEILPRLRSQSRREWPFNRHGDPVGGAKPVAVQVVPGRVPAARAPVQGLTRTQRVSQWMATASLASLLIAILTAVLMAPGFFSPAGKPDMATLMMFGSTALIGTWLVSLAIQMTEPAVRQRHAVEDHSLRRAALVVAGVLTGLAAWSLDEFLLLTNTSIYSPDDVASGLFSGIGGHPLLTVSHQIIHPSQLGYVVFFTGLFGLRGWWKMGDVHRDRRFSIGSTLLTTLVALLWTSLFSFPQTWGVLWSAMISVGLQLASPWCDERSQVIGARR